MADEETSYIIVDLPGEGGKELAAPGASWRIEGLNTANPVIVLKDGTELPAAYEQSMGTNLVFAARQEQQPRLIAKTNTILRVEQPIAKPTTAKGPGQTASAVCVRQDLPPVTEPAGQQDAWQGD